MEPVRTHSGTEAPADGSAETASPVAVGGGVALALALALALGFLVQRRQPPLPDLQRALPDDASTELGRLVPIEAGHPANASLLAMFQAALSRSREVLRSGLDRVFARPLDSASLDELEEALLRADVGVQTTEALL